MISSYSGEKQGFLSFLYVIMQTIVKKILERMRRCCVIRQSESSDQSAAVTDDIVAW